MISDVNIQKWIEHHGTATSFTFMVYGDLSQIEADLLIKGLIYLMDSEAVNSKMAVYYDPIDEEKAVAWKTYRGTSLQFIFAGDVIESEEIIKTIILDGLEFLKYKADYMGHNKSDNYV